MTDLNKKALKPCPFCGGSDFLKVEPYQFPPDEEGDAWQWGYNVVCDASGFEGSPKGCGASSPWQETPDEAVVSWNRRAIEAATPPDVAGLTDAIEACDWSGAPIGNKAILRHAATALRLSAGGGVPEGWKIVPKRMTAAMINAWSGGETVSADEIAYRTTFQDAWSRVLTASPTVEAGQKTWGQWERAQQAKERDQ